MTARMKPLSEIGLGVTTYNDLEIQGIALHTHEVRSGFLFAALPGTAAHGAVFFSAALNAGASAILTDPEGQKIIRSQVSTPVGIPLIVVEDARASLARAAALWFGSQPQTVVAVTGTNGKTSIASFTRQIWEHLGLAAINIGTTGIEGSWNTTSTHTTPDSLTLHNILHEADLAGISHAAMEASSHGLEQKRLEGVHLRAAAFSNLTQDHLDYHKTMDAYYQAKARLFSEVLPKDATAVINLDGARGQQLADLVSECELDLLTVGRQSAADLRIVGQRFTSTGQELHFSWKSKKYVTELNLIGGFQAENVALALGLVLACEAQKNSGEQIQCETIFATLPRLQGVTGRMQLAATRKNGASIFVDYAHTPNAIETALQALRPHIMGKIIIVFGAGGDRDRSKRPLMGAAAAKYADHIFVTDDNPRGEDPAKIRAEIMASCPNATEVADRAEAILRAVDMLEAGDALLVAGKGHETGQIIAGQTYPFNDIEQSSLAAFVLDGVM